MLLTGFVWCLVGILFGRAPSVRSELYSFFAISSLCYFVFIWGFSPPQATPAREVLWLMVLLLPSSLAEIWGFLWLKRAMDTGNQGISWCIAQSAMIIPFLGAVLLLGKSSDAIQWIGLAVLLAGLATLRKNNSAKTDSPKSGRSSLCFAFGALLLIGVSQFLRLIPGNIGFSAASLSWRLPVLATASMLFWLIYTLCNHCFILRKVWKISVCYGLIITIGQCCFFWSVDAADRVVVTQITYPVAVGSSIVLFCIFCTCFRKERLAIPAICGLALVIAGIAMLSC